MFIDWEQNMMFQLRALALSKQDGNILVQAQRELLRRACCEPAHQVAACALIFILFVGWLVLSAAQFSVYQRLFNHSLLPPLGSFRVRVQPASGISLRLLLVHILIPKWWAWVWEGGGGQKERELAVFFFNLSPS